MHTAEQLEALEVEYARFSLDRTLSSAAPGAVETCSVGGALLLADRTRPKSTYANRVLGLGPESLGSLDAVFAHYPAGTSPRIDLRLENATPAVVGELLARGYRHSDSLCYMAAEVGRPLGEPAGNDIRRWTADEADAFLDLLETAGGDAIPAEIRAAKRERYCTERFRTFVGHVEGRPVAWATLYVMDDGRHGYMANAFTQPEFRGRGMQWDLLLARMRDAADLGLRTVVTDVEPGTTSLRNCRRVGLQIESVHLLWDG